MAESLEDINLPSSAVVRLMKEVLPEGTTISKDAKTAVARAASIFALYITASSNNIAMENKRRTMNGEDVLKGLVASDFGLFEEPIKEAFEEFKKSQKLKKAKKMSKELKIDPDETVKEEKTQGENKIKEEVDNEDGE